MSALASRRAALGLLCLGSVVLTGFTVVRDPAVLQPIVWPSGAVTMVLQQNGAPSVTDGTDLSALRAALAVWGAPACTDFVFTDGGTSATSGDGTDGVNRMSFLSNNWPGGAASGAIALSNRRRSGTSWTEADVIFNAQYESWATDGDPHAHDIQSVATHELGHVLGLQHAVLPEASMYPSGLAGLTYGRTLHPDDIAGVCFLYPAAAFVCNDDGDCPLYDGVLYGGTSTRTVCSAPNCAAGQAAFAADCTTGGQCGSGACVLDPEGGGADDPRTCSQTCVAPNGACPAGARCLEAGGTDYCFPGRDDCATDGECGGTNWYCAADLDGRFRCLRACVTDIHCGIVAGTICDGGVSGSEPGFCRTPGVGAAGSSCEHGLDCQSLRCTGGGATPTCAALDAEDGAPPADGGPVGGDPGGGGGDPGGGGGGDPNGGAGDPGGPNGGDPRPGGDGPFAAPAPGTTDGDTQPTGCACRAGAGGVELLALVALTPLFFRRRRLTRRSS